MKSIGIVICNYNKKEAVLSCIQSVMESKFQDYDILVVDNASTDGSAEAIMDQFGDKLTLIVNEENLGGSGGFNTGLRAAINLKYKYIMCLDNDVLVDEDAIYTLFTFLEEHRKVGMVGSKIYHLEEPNYVQQFGLNIDFNHYCLETLCENRIEDGSMDEIIYCDAVATCCMMARTEVIERIGVMPEENYIYWDDIEWGYLCKKAGYQVAVYGASKALHAMGAKKVSESTFPTYYMWRNWIRFFMKYTAEDKLEHMSLAMLKGAHDAIFECAFKGEHHLKETILFAYRDALNDITGKADEGKIFIADRINDKLGACLNYKNCVGLDLNGYDEYKMKITNFITESNPDIQIEFDNTEKCEITLKVCDNIFYQFKEIQMEKSLNENGGYIDCNGNTVISTEDLNFIKNYDFSMEYFIYNEQPYFIHQSKKLRKNIHTCKN